MQPLRPGIVKAGMRTDWAHMDGSLVRAVLGDLAALLDGQPSPALGAVSWGTPACGGARLMRSGPGEAHESLEISWNHSKIERFEIESRGEASSKRHELRTDPAALLTRLVPMVWAHIRSGGELPTGIERFARFF